MDTAYKEKLTKIVTAAAAAPSGDNSQPWRFVSRAPDMLEFHALPERDNALLNVDDSGTFIALGAAIQNAELEAKALGFNPEIRYGAEDSLTATFVLHGEGNLSLKEQELQRAIPLRHTNRKAYEKVPLTEDDRRALVEVAGETEGVSLALVEDRESMSRISRALTTMEEIALKNKTLHKIFFESIFWSEERNAAGGHGLFIKTLELPPPARLLFKVLPYWLVASLLAKIGFPRMVAETNARQNASASAFGVITIDRFDRRNYIEAGRLLERVWLAAAARGMALQIVTGLLFLSRALDHNDSDAFSAPERARVRHASNQIREVLGGEDEPFLTFRVGHALPPSAVSSRIQPILTEAI